MKAFLSVLIGVTFSLQCGLAFAARVRSIEPTGTSKITTTKATSAAPATQGRFRPVTKLGVRKTDPLVNRSMKDIAAQAKVDQRTSTANAVQLRNNSLAAKQATIAKQNEAIRNGMQQSGDKADRAMNAATQSMATGVMSGASQIGAATAGNLQAIGKTNSAVGNFVSSKSGSSNLTIDSRSNASRKAAINLQATSNAAERNASRADVTAVASKERSKQMKDNIRKVIDLQRNVQRCPGC
jgi:hypothetical protein